jgi:hypothetical protein
MVMKELLEEEEKETGASAAGSQLKRQAKVGKSEKKKKTENVAEATVVAGLKDKGEVQEEEEKKTAERKKLFGMQGMLLINAARDDDTTVRTLLSAPDALSLMNYQDENGVTPLYIAAHNGHAPVTKQLIEAATSIFRMRWGTLRSTSRLVQGMSLSRNSSLQRAVISISIVWRWRAAVLGCNCPATGARRNRHADTEHKAGGGGEAAEGGGESAERGRGEAAEGDTSAERGTGETAEGGGGAVEGGGGLLQGLEGAHRAAGKSEGERKKISVWS